MKKLLCMMLAAALLFSAGACQREEPKQEIQIDPTSGSENRKETNVALYFGDANYQMLVREVRKIRVSVDAKVEKTAVEELLVGPSATIGMRQLINPDTEVIKVSQEGKVLTVVLSSEFLDWSFIEQTRPMEEINMVKQLAVYSVVNTLVEATGCYQVQILVEREDDGTGQRVNLSELGMAQSGVLEPLARNGEVVLSAQNTMGIILRNLVDRNYTAIYNYLAYEEASAERPSESTFVSWLEDSGITLESYTITEMLEQSNQKTAYIMVNYTLKQSTAQREYRSYPVKLVQENSLWKISFSDLEKLLEY